MRSNLIPTISQIRAIISILQTKAQTILISNRVSISIRAITTSRSLNKIYFRVIITTMCLARTTIKTKIKNLFKTPKNVKNAQK